MNKNNPANQSHSFFEDASDGIFIADREGNYTDVNKKGCNILGYAKEELLKMHISDLIAVNGNYIPPRLDELRAGKVLLTERNLIHKDGRHIPVEISSKMLPDGNLYAIVRDISARKKAEANFIHAKKELEKSEAQLKEAQGIAHLGNWETDLLTNKSSWSDEAYRIFGLEPGEKIATRELFFSFIHPEDSEEVKQKIKEAQQFSRKFQLNFKIIRTNNEVRYMHSEGHFEFDSSRKPVRLHGIIQDVTERQKNKEELLHSESMLKHAQAIAHLGSWELDFATGMAVWSDEALRIYGLPTSENIQSFESWIAFIHPEDLDFVKKEIEKSQTSLSDSSMYHRIICKDGTVKHVHSVSKFKFNKENKPIGLYGIAHDVTERKIAEANFLKGEKRYRALIEKSTDMKTLATPDGKVLYTSPSLTKVLGYSAEELTNRPAFELIHPDDLPGLMENMLEIMNTPGKSFYREQRLLHKNGKWIWCEGTVTNLLHEPGINALVSNFRDITERREAELALHLSEERYRNLFYNNPLPMWIYDEETKRFLEVNNVAINKYGYTCEEFLSMTINDIRSAEDVEKQNAVVKQSTPNGKVHNGYWSHFKKNGELIFVEITAHLIDYKGKKATLVLSNDITKRKLSEEKLKEVNKELETFIYKASHDLRSPLASVLGLVNVSKMDIKDAKPLHYLKMIEDLAKKLDDTLLELVLSMQIKDAKSFDDKIDFKEVISEILNKLKHNEGYDLVKITSDVQVGFPFASSKLIIGSLFQNMIVNAIKYRNKSAKSFFKINVSSNENEVKIEFADNGIGISPSVKDKIFDMYFRATDASTGSGLGLYLVKTGVEKLGGKINVESVLGKGTAFVVSLPLYPVK